MENGPPQIGRCGEESSTVRDSVDRDPPHTCECGERFSTVEDVWRDVMCGLKNIEFTI